MSKIVNARQIDVRQHRKKSSQIKDTESRARSRRESIVRSDLKKKIELSKSNQKLAVKLFSQKPTYQVGNLER